VTNRLSKAIIAMIGRENMSTGRIQFEMLIPELNHTTISLSRYQRDSVSRTERNIVSDNSMGRNLSRLKPSRVLIASLARLPAAATPM
jgi:hypothetical protein